MAHPRFLLFRTEHVIQAAGSMISKPVRKWGCVVAVQGAACEYPIKQLTLNAANLVKSPDPLMTPADFNSHSAVGKLKDLGFEVRYHGDG
jgi:hypothetical protein